MALFFQLFIVFIAFSFVYISLMYQLEYRRLFCQFFPLIFSLRVDAIRSIVC